MADQAEHQGHPGSCRREGRRPAAPPVRPWAGLVVLAALGLVLPALAGRAAGQERKDVLPPPTPLPAGPPGFGPRLGDLIGGAHPRLEGLPAGTRPPVGTTPVPDRATYARYERLLGHDFKDPESTIDLVVNRPRIWVLKQAPIRIQVGDEKIMSYTPVGNDPRELSLIGQQVGSTVLNVWVGDPNDVNKQTILSYLVQVMPDPEAKERLERVYKALQDEINRAFPDAYVCLFLVGDKLVVSGQVKDAVEATQILRIVRANAPATGQQPGQPGVQPAANVPVTQAALNLGPGGIGPDGLVRQSVDSYLLQGDRNVIDLLRIPGEQQVMLKVTVAEVNRAAARSIGLNAVFRNNATMNFFAQLTGTVAANLPTVLSAGEVGLAIEALRSINMARSLAEPNLVTLNGRPAFFFGGGEFPVPVVTGATAVGLQGVNFIPFGVGLTFVPYISDKDRIQLQLTAVVSVRDNAGGTNFGTGANTSTFVPGLTTRNVSTTVELREGQTLAIAGLLQTSLAATSARVPLVGDIPIGGQLFRVDNTQSSEQELVLLVTPELVHPLEPKEVPPLPGSDWFEPGDLEFFLLGRLHSLRPYNYRSQVMDTLGRMAAYRHCELLYLAGPSGYCDP